MGSIEEQQAEIDELEKKSIQDRHALNNVIEMQQAKIDELQKRIDEALNFYNIAKSDVNIGMMKMAMYLKGNQNEH